MVRSILGRLRNRFNVSAAEVGGQGTWQRAVIGLSMSGSDEVALRRALGHAIDFVESMGLAQVLESEIELLRMPLAESTYFDAKGLPRAEASDGRGDEEDPLPWEVEAHSGHEKEE